MQQLMLFDIHLCVWCKHPESEHGKPGESPMGKLTDRLCPVPGVSSQFYTPPLTSSSSCAFEEPSDNSQNILRR